jgi:IclR family transcriptional regulator, pca regulon regulatory protein
VRRCGSADAMSITTTRRSGATVADSGATVADMSEASLPDRSELRRSRRYTQTLVNTFTVLRCFTAGERILGVTEIKRKTGLPLPTVSAYLRTLVALGYLEQTAARKYRLGLRVTELGMAAVSATGVPEVAHECMARLRDETGYTVGLAMLDALEIVYVHRLVGVRAGSSAINLDGQLGTRLSALHTAAGRVLLADLSEGARGLLSVRHAIEGVEDPGGLGDRWLLAELESARSQGFAVEQGERPGERLLAVAVPVRGATGEVLAALDVSAKKPLVSLVPRLLLASRNISERLGYRPARTVR